MREIVTNGVICMEDEYDFTYHVAGIQYTQREDDSFCYEITPNYSVISLLSDTLFQGIPGLDLSLRKSSYVRENIVPIFISERTPGENREDLWELLESCNMQYLNRLEWLIRTDTRYSGDNFYVSVPTERNVKIATIDELGTRSATISRNALEIICAGGQIITQDFVIDNSNRKAYYELFMAMYKTEKKYMDNRRRSGIKKSTQQGKYKGRTPIKLDLLKLNEIFYQYETGSLCARKASEMLGISVSTFFRRYRKYKEDLR